MKELRVSRYMNLLDNFATKVLRVLDASRRVLKLSRVQVLIFAEAADSTTVREEGSNKGIAVDGICYVAGSQMDAFGRFEIVAIGRTCAEVKGDGDVYILADF